MARQALIVSAFLLFLNVSLVLCREDYQQYYSNHYSHHHHKSTPADSVSSTEAPVSLSEETSVSGSANDIEVKTTDEDVKQHEFSLFGLSSDVKGSEKPVLQRSEETALPRTAAYTSDLYDVLAFTSDRHHELALFTRTAIILVCVGVPLIALATYICCRPSCCGGKRTLGYMLPQSGLESPLMHTASPAQQLPNYPPDYTFSPVQGQVPPKVQQTSQVQQQ